MRNGKQWIVAAGVMAMAAGVWGSEFSSKDVSADARWMAYADIAKLKTTQLGAYMMEMLTTDAAESKMAALQAVFNFDPRRDLDSLTMYGFGKGKEQDGVLVARGHFDPERLITLLKANDTYQETTHGGLTIGSWIDDHEADKAKKLGRQPKRSYGCVYANGIVVLSDCQANVEHAVDVLGGRLPSIEQNSPFADMSAWQDAYFFAGAANTAEMASLAPKAAVLKNASKVAMGIGETDGHLAGSVILDTDSAEAAMNLKRIMDGMIGLALLNAENNPAAAQLAQSVRCDIAGNRVQLSMSMPVAEVIKSIDDARKAKEDAAATPAP